MHTIGLWKEFNLFSDCIPITWVEKSGLMACVHNPSAEKWRQTAPCSLLASLTKSATPVSERPCLKKKGDWHQEIAFKIVRWLPRAAIHCIQTCVYKTKQQIKHGLSNMLENELCEHPGHGEWWFEPGSLDSSLLLFYQTTFPTSAPARAFLYSSPKHSLYSPFWMLPSCC